MLACNYDHTFYNHVVGLTLYVEEEDLTSWFNAASDNDTASRGNVSVSRKSATSVDVSFSSGMLVLITIRLHTNH